MANVQLKNVRCPMMVILFGMVTPGRLVQPENAKSPRLVTLLGMFALVRWVQP